MEEPKSHRETSAKLKHILRYFGSLLIEFTIPVFVGFIGWYLLADVLALWRLNRFLILLIFLTVVPGISLVANIALRAFIDWSKQTFKQDQRKPGTKGGRLLKTIIAGIIIPIVLSIAANLIPVSKDEDTFLTLALRRMMFSDDYPFIPTIGEVIITANSNETKLEGLKTLDIIHTDLVLDEFFKIFDKDRSSLKDYDIYEEMRDGIASYDVEARDRLLQLFFQSDEFAGETPRGLSPNLYEKFFEQSFNRFREEIENNVLDPQTRNHQLLLLDQVEVEMRSVLSEIERDKIFGEGGDPTLDFVLDTFIAMKRIEDDTELYFLAKNVAIDHTYATGTRARAILLLAKLGDRDDFPLLVSVLESNEDEILKQAALKGIGIIHKKHSEKTEEEGSE